LVPSYWFRFDTTPHENFSNTDYFAEEKYVDIKENYLCMSTARPQGPAGPRAAPDRPTGPHSGRGSSLTSSNHHRSNRTDRAVVVGILGKSRFGKSAIANALLDRPVFQVPLILFIWTNLYVNYCCTFVLQRNSHYFHLEPLKVNFQKKFAAEPPKK
jgi:hypothetical protein